MCRIVGFIDKTSRKYDYKKVLCNMRDTMILGGPDAEGIYSDSFINLGHRRLSILGLSESGNQPMRYEDLILSYNGEIYNFSEIQLELEEFGYQFNTRTDTEILLKSFDKWGLESVNKFRGMFAFSIYNVTTKKTYLCRDRFGVKPLYYYINKDLFMFSSTVAAFHKHPSFEKHISKEAFSQYIQYGYINTPISIFENTFKLEPGHWLIINKDLKVTKKKYWIPEDVYERNEGLLENSSEKEILNNLEKILIKSFQLRTISDVPIGVFLSGGIDSTLITAILQKHNKDAVKTFTVGFKEDEYDESKWARKVAKYLGTKHYEYILTEDDLLEVLPELFNIIDEPLGDPSIIPTYLISKKASKEVKVVLSGDGGDEIFAGYDKFDILVNKTKKIKKPPYSYIKYIKPALAGKIYKILRPVLPKYTNFIGKYTKLLNLVNSKDFEDAYNISGQYFNDSEAKALLKNFTERKVHPLRSISDIHRVMSYETNTFLINDVLTKIDRATMASSIEGREPLLDHLILEYTSKIPEKYKLKSKKYLLKKILKRYIPEKYFMRPKQGFSIPIEKWLKGGLKKDVIATLNCEKYNFGLMHQNEVKILLEQFYEENKPIHNKIWLLYIFNKWIEHSYNL